MSHAMPDIGKYLYAEKNKISVILHNRIHASGTAIFQSKVINKSGNNLDEGRVQPFI
jgi:hypothetical protein